MGGRSAQREARGFADARHLMRYAARLWSKLERTEWTHVWNGRVAFTADRLIHLHEPAPGLHVLVGFNGRGIAMTSAMGGELAKRIAGAPAEDLPLPLTGMKPYPFRSLSPVGVPLRMAYGRIRDRLGV